MPPTYDSHGRAVRVLSLILAGGEGRRLGCLTDERAKPAVPFGGRYRIIDIVLSNFVNSGLTKIKVLTQYKSHSLEQHIARAWRMSAILDQYIETVPAQQRTGKDWFKGSADAVFQSMNVINDERPTHVCVFGGDHVYTMDVRQMIDFHLQRKAKLSVAAIPVPKKEAVDFGVIKTDEHGRVLEFLEKVPDPPEMPGRPGYCLASMGNYVFDADALVDEVRRDAEAETSHDFGKNIVPTMVAEGHPVYAYDFATNLVPGQTEWNRGYWRDIGTIDSYWESQMDLVEITPRFSLYNPDWIIRTGLSHDPPAKFVFSDPSGNRVGLATDSLVSNGCIVSGGRLHRTVLAPRVRVNSYAFIEESVVLEGVNIGRHARIRRAILDKGVTVEEGAELGFDPEVDAKRGFTVSARGVTVVPRGTTVKRT
jgi:glucose-1-phosphate adenylyltransferase